MGSITDKQKLGSVHEDMERYLREDCYCPGEIYGVDGFFFSVYHVDDECVVVEQTDGITVVVTDEKSPQAIIFWHDDAGRPGRIISAQRVDATENNIGILATIAKGGKPDGRTIDEFEPGSLRKALSEILSISDMVMVS